MTIECTRHALKFQLDLPDTHKKERILEIKSLSCKIVFFFKEKLDKKTCVINQGRHAWWHLRKPVL